MASTNTKIEWTDRTWNPVTGCTPKSDGCKNCYATKMARRLHAMGNVRYRNGFQVTIHPDLFDQPLRWKKPCMVFVNSMGDMFHENIPLEIIQRVFETMVRARHHVFQVLTKRSTRLVELAPYLPWAENIWLGVTVESGKYLYRVENLRKTDAKTKFLSIEPMIGPVEGLALDGIDWVIVGGESGQQSRIIEKSWVITVRDACAFSKVPFFFKQWGGKNKEKAGRLLDGKIWNQFPTLPAVSSKQV